MVSRTKDYYMPHPRSWSLDAMKYDGLYSHFSVMKGVLNSDGELTHISQAYVLGNTRLLRHHRQLVGVDEHKRLCHLSSV